MIKGFNFLKHRSKDFTLYKEQFAHGIQMLLRHIEKINSDVYN